MAVDGRVARGEKTRRAVLDAGVALASLDGLAGLTLARLAQSLGVSKSGLFAHWPDKESLQLAIVAHARRQWEELIVSPALREPKGLRRLWAVHANRMAFYENAVLPGGCFFKATEHEFEDSPGPVRDAIAAALDDWKDMIVRLAGEAVVIGELRPEADPRQLAFEIQAIGSAVVTHAHLLRDPDSYRYARRAVLDRLRALATDPTIL
ncbi:AcrR family transcriptional regulator [Thermocatellispora tengchongensis]|uniref:AcrR family transcriptional regulator n=1 Tax=Thermocatellispora tengchongensis TaxID=1073253 RepID=A0A840NTV0_9ACTN|nr:TetR/AcrR family transcriptional regulator [Thermocatellispora tengchongensis]MBB5130998.1 AcrR family transcriptional regulator [Thermocatellispora tengchongensis]